MSLDLGIFVASDALGVLAGAVACYLVARLHGHGAAVRAGVVIGLSIATYTAVCLWLGFGLGAEFLASVAAVIVPLPVAAILVPSSMRDHLRGDH